MRVKLVTALLLAVGASGAASANIIGGAHATLRAPDGRVVGGAFIPVTRQTVMVRLAVRGLSPGRYGVHLHAVGRCEGPDFASAGAHWNPAGRQHGRLNPHGSHRGDLPNIEVGANGEGRLEFEIRGDGAWGGSGALFDADGASILIHAQPDDERTDPSGNSGPRIACGVLNY